MEDLTEKIAEILSNPEMMNTIKNISGLLGSPSENESCDDKESPPESEESSFSFPPEMMQMILKLMPILSSLNNEDDKYTRFLEALRPLLSEKKRKKLDESSKIFKIIRILPILKNQGIL